MKQKIIIVFTKKTFSCNFWVVLGEKLILVYVINTKMSNFACNFFLHAKRILKQTCLMNSNSRKNSEKNILCLNKK